MNMVQYIHTHVQGVRICIHIYNIILASCNMFVYVCGYISCTRTQCHVHVYRPQINSQWYEGVESTELVLGGPAGECLQPLGQEKWEGLQGRLLPLVH